MGDVFELVGDGSIDFGAPMAVDVAPQAGVAVDVFFSIGVDEEFVFGGNDDDGVEFVPELVLGERMPDVSAVPFDKLLFCGVRQCVLFFCGQHLS